MLFFNLRPRHRRNPLEILFLSRTWIAHAAFRIFLVAVLVTGSLILLEAPTAKATANSPKTELLSPARLPNSLSLPQYRESKSQNYVLRHYPKYLKFVLAIGKKSNPKIARALKATYTKLRRRSPQQAARFLQGLRLEIVHRVNLSGISRRNQTTRNKQMRKFVSKYLYEWYREADEHWLRAVATRTRY